MPASNRAKTESERLDEIRERRHHKNAQGHWEPYPTGSSWTRPTDRILADIDFMLAMIDDYGLGR